MIVCQFNFVLPVEPQSLMKMTRQVIVESGGTVTGELPLLKVSVPSMLGPIDAVCKLVEDSTINIAVTRKPELVSCDVIRTKLVAYLTQGVKMQAQMAKSQNDERNE